jgi:hypothetical protein
VPSPVPTPCFFDEKHTKHGDANDVRIAYVTAGLFIS